MATQDAWREDWRLAFPHQYIGAADLRGRDVHLTISRVELEDLEMFKGGRKERKRKLVLYFRELEGRSEEEPSKLLCNKTNAAVIACLYGKAVDEWVGQRITLYPAEVEAFGKTQEAVRIRSKTPAAKTSRQQRAPSEGHPPPAQRPAEPAADGGDELGDAIRQMFSELETVLNEPERIPDVRARIEALPDGTDRDVLLRQIARAERLAEKNP